MTTDYPIRIDHGFFCRPTCPLCYPNLQLNFIICSIQTWYKELFKKLVNGIAWETALRNKGAEQSYQIFKDIFLRAQELSFPMYKKLDKEGRRLAWLSKDPLVKLK